MGLGSWLVHAYCRGPHYRGKIHVARWLGRWLLPADGGQFTLADGTRMLLHPRDWIEYRLLQRGDYEPLTLEFLRRNLRPGDSAVFAGVNIGLHLIVAARAVGPSGKIIGIEPQPGTLLRARKNILLNELPDIVTLVSAGLAQTSSILPIAPPPSHNSGMASFLTGPGNCPFHVPVEPLGAILDRIGVRTPRVFLLDVEGFETEVLKGVQPQHAPDILLVEVKREHLTAAGSNEGEIWAILSALGYQTCTLDGRPAQPGSDLPEFNLVAVRGETDWQPVVQR